MNIASRSALIAILASIPTTAHGQCPETAQLNECELALFETATILDGQNKERVILLDACRAKLKARTSTVIQTIIAPCPMIEEQEEPWAVYTVTFATSLLLGLITGLLLK
tara:strand:- start:22564 stop:22893 length:330 start_codon:yes stop_codon:yes gene_type:complete